MHVCMCVCMHVYISEHVTVGTGVFWCMRGRQRTAWGAGTHFWPCLRSSLLLIIALACESSGFSHLLPSLHRNAGIPDGAPTSSFAWVLSKDLGLTLHVYVAGTLPTEQTPQPLDIMFIYFSIIFSFTEKSWNRYRVFSSTLLPVVHWY